MTKHTIPSLRSALIAFGMVVVGLIVVGEGRWSPDVHPNQSNDLPVVSKTQAFQVIGVAVVTNRVSLRLKNVSSKFINAYTLALRDGGTITTDYSISGHSIAPEQIEEKTFPVGDSQLSQRISIECVVFTDNSSDGDPDNARYIKSRRRGEKLQLQRQLPLLSNLITATDADMVVRIKEVKSQFQALPDYSTDTTSDEAFNQGLCDAKQEALLWIERLEKKQANGETTAEEIRKEVSKQVGQNEKRIPRLY